MSPPIAWEGPSEVMLGMRPVMSPMEAWTKVSPGTGLSAVVDSLGADAIRRRAPPTARSEIDASRAASVKSKRAGRILLFLRGGGRLCRGGSGGSRRRSGSGRGRGGHDALGTFV